MEEIPVDHPFIEYAFPFASVKPKPRNLDESDLIRTVNLNVELEPITLPRKYLASHFRSVYPEIYQYTFTGRPISPAGFHTLKESFPCILIRKYRCPPFDGFAGLSRMVIA